MSLFIDDKKLIALKFHYIETPGQHVSKFEFLKDKAAFERNKDNPNLKEINTSWKPLGWKDHNEIYSKCLSHHTKEDGSVTTNLNYIKFRDMKLKFCLKSWDLKDDDGRPVPVNASAIDRLNPQVATEILEGFEKVTEVPVPALPNKEIQEM